MQQKYYFHGSYDLFPRDFLLRGGRPGYHEEWSVLNHYDALHHHKPEGRLSHKDAVFMCADINDLDACGAATETTSVLLPLSDVSWHDMQWTGQICELIDSGVSIDNDQVRRLCLNYWNGVPTSDPLWECLTREARVVWSLPTEDDEVLLKNIADEEFLSFDL